MKQGRQAYLVLLVLFIITGLLVYNKRKPRERFHYKGELFADQAGYYVYLPAAFIYNFDGKGISDKKIGELGSGFRVDASTGKIVTKYSVGVAMMQMPFFLATHLYNVWKGANADGFSGNYHNVPNWASWFYSSMGLWLLYLFLRRRVRVAWSILILVTVYFGTSTYYYSADNTGMSHVYSFFLFNALLYALDRISVKGIIFSHTIMVGLICGLVVVVRPINVLMIPVVGIYVYWLNGLNIKWLLNQISIKKMIIGVVAGFSMILPQLLYWKLTSGSWVYYSYEGEGFVNWMKPEITAFYFSPLAGLFSYSPAYFIAIAAIIFAYKRKENRILIVGFFAFSYLMASWHQYNFGCSFGSRNLVDFSGLFLVPLAVQLEAINLNKRKIWMTALLVVCSVYTMNLLVSFRGCYNSRKWEWTEFKQMMLRGVYYSRIQNRVMEADDMYLGISPSLENFVTIEPYKLVTVHVDAHNYGPATELAFEVLKDSIISFATVNLTKESVRDGGDIYYEFVVPDGCPRDADYKAYLMNLGGDRIKVNSMSIWMH